MMFRRIAAVAVGMVALAAVAGAADTDTQPQVPTPPTQATPKPAPKPAVKPAPKDTLKPATTDTATPAPKDAAKPAPKDVAKPIPKDVAKPTPKDAAKPVPKAPAQAGSPDTVKVPPTGAGETKPKEAAKPPPKETASKGVPKEWKRYTDAALGVTFAFPPDWRLVKDFDDGVPEDHPPHGIALQIAPKISEGTNLDGAMLSIVGTPAKDCSPESFGVSPYDDKRDIHTVTADGRSYTAGTSHDDVGFGEFYDTKVFVVNGLTRCVAVKYFIHLASMTHFAPGEAKEFDPKTLWQVYDAIRASMIFKK